MERFVLKTRQPFKILVPGLLILLVVGALAACGGSLQAETDEATRIARVLDLRPGTSLADVGAGDGEWSEKLMPFIEPDGRIYATEVDEDELERIRERIEENDLRNVRVVVGDQETTGLSPSCCDTILLRMVYHHFTDPARMRADLKRALRPRGLIAIIDILPQKDWRELPGTPDRGGHGIEMETLIAEMAEDGFAVVQRFENWDDEEDRYCVVFRR